MIYFGAVIVIVVVTGVKQSHLLKSTLTAVELDTNMTLHNNTNPPNYLSGNYFRISQATIIENCKDKHDTATKRAIKSMGFDPKGT